MNHLTRPTRLLIALFMGTLLAACSQDRGFESSATKIVGGKPVRPHEYKSVVGLAFKSDRSEKFFIECTGTIIHPHIILTAGHCLADIAPSTHQDPNALNKILKIYQGSGIEGGQLPENVPSKFPNQFVKIKAINVHPNLRLHVSGNADFGYLVVDTPFASNLVAPFYPQALPNLEGVLATIVGFGRREENNRGLKFKVSDKIIQPFGHEFSIGSSGKDACEGDSGGHVFVKRKGANFVAGIISRGKSFDCGEGGYAGYAAFARCWIQTSSGIDLQAPCELRNTVYSPKELTRLTIPIFCAHPTPAQRRTLSALATLSKISKWRSCQNILTSLSQIEQVDLNSFELVDIAPLALLPNLKTINLRYNSLTDISALAALPNLETLDIAANNIANIPQEILLKTNVQGMTWQQALLENTVFLNDCLNFEDLSSDQKVTIEALKWKVMVDDCKVANLRLLSMKSLSLSGRNLNYVLPLAGMWKLEELNVADNEITDISPLAALENLKKLTIKNNPVDSLEPLQVLVDKGLVILN